MDAIAKNVYIEERFLGVTLGVIVQPRGMIQIDAPPAPEDGRAWRASMMGMGGGHERVLINLDSHPDRTLGVRSMDCTVIAHEKTAQAFHNRPNTFKAQGDETGANWEAIPGLGSVRWAPPEISFGHQLTLHWGDSPVILESHPGPTQGASWVVLPNQKIVFVGDAVMKGQPPFLAHADLEPWIETLEVLLSSEYKGFTIVSGRGGIVTPQAVRSQSDSLNHMHDKLEALGKKRSNVAVTDKLAEQLLKEYKAPASKHKQYAHRLSYGLRHYYLHHYQPSSRHMVEE